MSRPLAAVTAYFLVCSASCTPMPEPRGGAHPDRRPELVRPSTAPPQARGTYAVDAGGRAIRTLESGSTLHVGAQALQPLALYEFRVALDDGRPVSFARTSTDRTGNIEPFVLWYESGVTGCSTRRVDGPDPQRFRFRTFEEAEAALAGRSLVVTTHRVASDTERAAVAAVAALRAGNAEWTFRLPISARRSPMVFPSDSSGCLSNAGETGRADMHVSGRNFTPGEEVELSVVPNQRAWYEGDAVSDITGTAATSAPERVRAGADGRFTARVWPRTGQFSGAFDIVAHRVGDPLARPDRRLGRRDIVSFGTETAYLLFLTYPPGGPHMDLAGRPLGMTPYFEFTDAFAETADPVWGAVDPTYVPAGHPGGTFAAYYVVNHKTEAQWLADMALSDVSGGIEIHPVKAGCVNATDVIIWNTPLNLGKYDVVVEFGTAPANSVATFTGDGIYNSAIDFLDGAIQVGFEVARDPWELGPVPIGTDSYSQDDFFPSIGAASNVDLRAVVRYPATVAGTGTPVAAGAHPIFVMEHGNHRICTDGSLTHATCPAAQRVKNHEGYMRLLDILASHGVIAVSIDAYDLTGFVPQWIVERGTLILKHLELWSHMNSVAQFPAYPDFFAGRFAGKVNLANISVSGHSRGGEASVSAYMLNAASAAPFAIGSVSSIAPVDGQAYVLPAVPYYVILPAADCDVDQIRGQRIYDRAGSAIAEATTKSATYIHGANHNFFNTVWAADGDDCGALAREDYIVAGNQQRIGEAYLAGFHRAAMLGSSVYEDMLRGTLIFPSTAGYKIYSERHEANHTKLLSGGAPAALVAAGGATVASVNNPTPHQTAATQIGWSAATATATYTVPAGQVNAAGFEVLSFRVAQTTAAANPANSNQNFQVELVGGGVTRAVYVGQFDIIPRRYPHPEGYLHTVMTTVRVPLHSFIMNNSGLTLNNVDTIRLKFLSPTAGDLYVDDVEFSR